MFWARSVRLTGLVASDSCSLYADEMTFCGPNLFDYATSELSQDAALCWCIAWADSRHAPADPAMHAIGRDLVASMFRAAKAEVPGGDYTVTISRQLEHVDIVAELGADYLLVIEDKVHSAEHSDQLNTYAQALKALYPERQIVFIFLKTGDQSSYRGVQAALWTTFLRQDLLEVLRHGGECRNAIYVDFLAMIERREAAVQRFRTTPVAEWGPGDPAYVGLFLQLQVLLGDGDWRYVPNPSGGFLGSGGTTRVSRAGRSIFSSRRAPWWRRSGRRPPTAAESCASFGFAASPRPSRASCGRSASATANT